MLAYLSEEDVEGEGKVQLAARLSISAVELSNQLPD